MRIMIVALSMLLSAPGPILAQEADDEQDGILQDALESISGKEWSRLLIRGHIQASFTLNPDDPDDRQNFGRLFDDRSNDFRFNGLTLTLEQPFQDPAEWDWSFKLQLTAGSDARFTHGIGLLDNATNASIQPDVVESWIAVHFPVLTDGGIDLKLGTFATLCGLETMDPTTTPLFSRGYIFNFGVPLKHTGALATVHVTDWFDLHAGVVTGINTAIDDNNDAVSFHGGANARFLDNNLSFGLGVHYGPENDSVFHRVPGVDPDDDDRFIIDLVITAVPCEWLTLYTDLNLGHDQAGLGLGGESPEWYGAAQYFVFHAASWVDIVLRGEVFRDDDGFAVVQFAENDDLMDVQSGRLGGLDPRTVGGGENTYYALTLGAGFKATDNLLIQTEIRADFAGKGAPFDDSQDDEMFTVGVAVLWRF